MRSVVGCPEWSMLLMVGWSGLGGVLRKSAALMLIAALVAISVAYPLLDGDDTPASTQHFDAPVDFGSHGASHNHLVCAVLGSTHSLPGAIRSTHETRDCVLAVRAAVIEGAPHTSTPFQTRPRAPPVS